MSGVIKKLGKALKRVVKSKVFKIIVIAAAVYFTAGIAAGAMGSTFAAGLPGIATAAETLGITAGAFAPMAADTIAMAAGGLGMGLEAGVGSAAMATGDAMAVGAASSAEMAAAAGMGEAVSGVPTVIEAGEAVSGAVEGLTPMAEYAGSPLGVEAPQALSAGQEQFLANSSAMEGGGTVQSAGYDFAPTVEHPASAAVQPAGGGTMPNVGTLEGATPGIGNTATPYTAMPEATEITKAVSDGTGVWNKFTNWWGDLSPTSQTIIGQAGFGVAKGVYEGIAGKNAADDAAEARKDLHRVNYVDNSGIVNKFFQSEFSPKRG